MWLLPKATCRPSDFGGVCPDIRCTRPVPRTRPVHYSEEPTWDGDRKIVRGTANEREFRKRFGVKRLAMSSD
jgi:hypothetical protein